MIIYKSECFDSFRCLAGACPDSCCKEWAVQVDEQSAEFYRSLPGPLGDRLRQVLIQEDGDTVLQIEDGRCPMWRSDGLCRIQAELGEEALCRTCKTFPRLSHDYGDFVEYGLELSCPEAARLILSGACESMVCREEPGGDAPEYDREAMEILLASRERVLEILSDRESDVPTALKQAMLYGLEAQAWLDTGEEPEFDPEKALADADSLARPGDPVEMLEFFRSLEILTPQWPLRLEAPGNGPWTEALRYLACYFVRRYWLQAVSDYDLYSRVKLMILSCLVIRLLGGDVLQTSQLYAKEIENNMDNLEALLDAAYTCPAFLDGKLLGYLGGK